jgi:hypothetical protein
MGVVAAVLAGCSGGSPEVALGPTAVDHDLPAGCTAATRFASKSALNGPLTDHSGASTLAEYDVTRTGLGYDHDVFLTNRTSHPFVVDSVYLTGVPGAPTPVVVHEGILPKGGSQATGIQRLLAGNLPQVPGFVVPPAPPAPPAGAPTPPLVMYAAFAPMVYLALRVPACAVDGRHPPGYAVDSNIVLGYHLEGSHSELFAVLPWRTLLCVRGLAPPGCSH